MQDPRERLLRRVEVEARAFANSYGTTSQLRLGRVQGLLEAGVLAGYWCKKDSAAAAELVQHRYRISKLRDVLLRGDEVKLWKVTDIAEFLGVSTQRVDQLALAGDPGTPPAAWAALATGSDRESRSAEGKLVGRRWPSLATQAIGDRGSPRWKHSGVPGARGRARAAKLPDADRICKLYGWPQTFARSYPELVTRILVTGMSGTGKSTVRATRLRTVESR